MIIRDEAIKEKALNFKNDKNISNKETIEDVINSFLIVKNSERNAITYDYFMIIMNSKQNI